MTDTNRSEHNSAALQDNVLQDDAPRAGARPMLWLLLLLAVGAFAWWYFASRDATAPPIGSDLAIIEGTTDDVAPAAAGDDELATTTPRRSGSPADNNATATSSPRSSEPLLLSAAQPRYPSAERQRGVEGNVTLRIDVGANGVPTDVDYAHRSGNRALDRAALTAARNWRFQPAIRNGEAVASTVNVPVAFRL